ncbi:MAG: site-specific integrase [Thermoleophilia bacterium]|nr:site-specific integrase [Thermoleophilia bacterium]
MRKYESTLRIDVLPRIGHEPVTAIQRGQLQRMVDELAVERSAEHARKALVAMRVLMRLADRDGLIDNDPCRGVRAPADPEPMRAARVLEPHEITAIIDAADQDDLRLGRSLGGPLLALLAFTGLRLGEALALPWGPEGVDLENRCLHVLRAMDRVRGLDGRFPFIPPKTRASRRTVPIGADLTRRLVAHRARSRTRQDGELVFTDPGRPLIPNSQPRRAFQRAVRDAGIHEPFPKLHDLRHAYASALLAAGLTVHAVAQLLGHSSPQLVMARYGHAYRTEVLSAADRLDALMAERGTRAA